MNIPDFFISCDWGTTNFRLRLVQTDSLEVLVEHKTDQGIKTLYEKYMDQKEVNQSQFFSDYLKKQIRKFPVDHRQHIVIATGMTSSNIGLQELDYADLPFDQNGSNLCWKHISLQNGLDVLLISGVKSDTGMMRGEEVQAIGLGEYLISHEKGTLLLPGTHSKHILYEKGNFTGLKNFMTGELFELLSNKSILSSSVINSEWSKSREGAFKKGVEQGVDCGLTTNLFSIRANHIIKHSKKEDNYYFLSGMLIGDELSYLRYEKNKIFLAAPDPIFTFYKLALEIILDPQQLVLFDDKILKYGLLAGQKKILKHYVK